MHSWVIKPVNVSDCVEQNQHISCLCTKSPGTDGQYSLSNTTWRPKLQRISSQSPNADAATWMSAKLNQVQKAYVNLTCTKLNFAVLNPTIIHLRFLTLDLSPILQNRGSWRVNRTETYTCILDTSLQFAQKGKPSRTLQVL